MTVYLFRAEIFAFTDALQGSIDSKHDSKHTATDTQNKQLIPVTNKSAGGKWIYLNVPPFTISSDHLYETLKEMPKVETKSIPDTVCSEIRNEYSAIARQFQLCFTLRDALLDSYWNTPLLVPGLVSLTQWSQLTAAERKDPQTISKFANEFVSTDYSSSALTSAILSPVGGDVWLKVFDPISWSNYFVNSEIQIQSRTKTKLSQLPLDWMAWLTSLSTKTNRVYSEYVRIVGWSL